jgi:hypothetical protein
MTDVQVVEKLHAETVGGDRRDHNKDLLSSNYILDMRPCNATDHHRGSD